MYLRARRDIIIKFKTIRPARGRNPQYNNNSNDISRDGGGGGVGAAARDIFRRDLTRPDLTSRRNTVSPATRRLVSARVKNIPIAFLSRVITIDRRDRRPFYLCGSYFSFNFLH